MVRESGASSFTGGPRRTIAVAPNASHAGNEPATWNLTGGNARQDKTCRLGAETAQDRIRGPSLRRRDWIPAVAGTTSAASPCFGSARLSLTANQDMEGHYPAAPRHRVSPPVGSWRPRDDSFIPRAGVRREPRRPARNFGAAGHGRGIALARRRTTSTSHASPEPPSAGARSLPPAASIEPAKSSAPAPPDDDAQWATCTVWARAAPLGHRATRNSI